MDNIHLVETATGGPFTFRAYGEVHDLPDPADLNFQHVLMLLRDEVPPTTVALVPWKAALLFGRWQAHYDLPDYQSANRLAYLVDHYRSALVYDLQGLGADLGALWRSRRWRTLLDLIDHLPGHSWYNAAVSGDEEHAEMIAESLAARQAEGEETPDDGPALQTWTPEVAALTQILDAVRGVQYAIVASNSEKGKTPKPPEPAPRPHTPLEAAIKRARYSARKARHDELAKRLLPHKR